MDARDVGEAPPLAPAVVAVQIVDAHVVDDEDVLVTVRIVVEEDRLESSPRIGWFDETGILVVAPVAVDYQPIRQRRLVDQVDVQQAVLVEVRDGHARAAGPDVGFGLHRGAEEEVWKARRLGHVGDAEHAAAKDAGVGEVIGYEDVLEAVVVHVDGQHGIRHEADLERPADAQLAEGPVPVVVEEPAALAVTHAAVEAVGDEQIEPTVTIHVREGSPGTRVILEVETRGVGESQRPVGHRDTCLLGDVDEADGLGAARHRSGDDEDHGGRDEAKNQGCSPARSRPSTAVRRRRGPETPKNSALSAPMTR